MTTSNTGSTVRMAIMVSTVLKMALVAGRIRLIFAKELSDSLFFLAMAANLLSQNSADSSSMRRTTILDSSTRMHPTTDWYRLAAADMPVLPRLVSAR